MGRWSQLHGDGARTMRRAMASLDSAVSCNGRLLAQAFSGQLRDRVAAA